MDYDRRGRLAAFEFSRALVRNHARLTYRLVQQLLTGKDRNLRRSYREFLKMLGWMEELCALLRERREERGSLLLSLPEAEVVLDEKGWPVDVRRVDQLTSHQIIEEFMIAANETVRSFWGAFPVPGARTAHRRQGRLAASQSLGFVLPKGAQRDPRVLRGFLGGGAPHPPGPMVQLNAAALFEAGPLRRRGPGPLRPGYRVVHPFHLTHPALSRPGGAPPVAGQARRPQG